MGSNPAPSLCSCITGQDILPLSFGFLPVQKQIKNMCLTDPWQKVLSALRPKNSSPSEQLVHFNLTNAVAVFLMLTGGWEAKSKVGALLKANPSVGSCSYSCVSFHAYFKKNFNVIRFK